MAALKKHNSLASDVTRARCQSWQCWCSILCQPTRWPHLLRPFFPRCLSRRSPIRSSLSLLELRVRSLLLHLVPSSSFAPMHWSRLITMGTEGQRNRFVFDRASRTRTVWRGFRGFGELGTVLDTGCWAHGGDNNAYGTWDFFKCIFKYQGMGRDVDSNVTVFFYKFFCCFLLTDALYSRITYFETSFVRPSFPGFECKNVIGGTG